MSRVTTNIRFYLPSDPFYYQVQNLPLKDLLTNDEILQFQLDQLKAQIDSLSGRELFGDLKPYVSESSPGKVFVKPGNFIARVNTPSDRYTGLGERQNKGEQGELSRGDVKAQPEDSAYGLNHPDKVGGVGRTALVRLLQENNIDPNITIPSFTQEDYPGGDTGSNKTPVYRLDLLFIEAYPAEDQDNAKPKLGLIKGGYFLDFPANVSESRKAGQRFETGEDLVGGTVHQQSKDINEIDVIDEKKGGVTGIEDKLRYTTIPAVEDIKNYEWRPIDLVNDPINSFEIQDFDIPDQDQLAEWAQTQLAERGVFCLPIAYVLTPFGHIEGGFIPAENLMDIRPFFRTAELTFDERQAVAVSYRPSIKNRFLTRLDPDYATLRNSIVKGSGLVAPGNHEGRISKLEDDLPIGTYLFDRAGPIFLIDSAMGGQTTEFTYRGTSDLDLNIEIPYTSFNSETIDLTKIRGLVVRLDVYLKAGGSNNSSVRLITKVTKPSINVYYEVADLSAWVVGRQSSITFMPVDLDLDSMLFNLRYQIQGLPDSSDPVQCKAYVIGVFY
jgi:hypothetical protein